MQEINPQSLLMQVPLVALFIWFVLKQGKEWREFLSLQNKQFVDALDKLGLRIEKSEQTVTSFGSRLDTLVHYNDTPGHTS